MSQAQVSFPLCILPLWHIAVVVHCRCVILPLSYFAVVLCFVEGVGCRIYVLGRKVEG